jgi:hypothetical protein
MKRVLIFLLPLIFMFSLISGCGEKAVKDVDFNELSADLLESGAFSDLLCPLTADIAASLYGIEPGDFQDFTLYCSTGATAEEIALFKAADESAALRIKEAAEKRIQNQILSYESYVPAEVPKLENAVVRQEGVFVFYVTSNDSEKVDGIINSYTSD